MTPGELTPRQIEQIRQERIMKAYRDLFGTDPNTRSVIQQTVWEDLKLAGYADQTEWIPDKTGALCPIRAALAGGRRSLFLYIQSNVEFAPGLEQSK